MYLSQEDAALFYRLLFTLQFYVNQTLALHPAITTLAAYQALDQQSKVVVRDALYAQPALLEQFVAQNPAQLTPAELTIVAHWKYFVAGDFYIERYLPDASIWIACEPPATVYRVRGITHSLATMIDRLDLPRRVHSVLLPFKGQIIYDGLLSTYQGLFGGGVKSALRAEYIAAKQRGQIVAQLETG